MRRQLGFSIDEWQALPWWQERVYRDGLTEEFTGEEPVYEAVPSGESEAEQMAWPAVEPGVSDVPMQAMGMNVVHVNFGG